MGEPFDIVRFVAEARRIGIDTQRVEVKEAAKGLPKSIVDTISAFTNGSGGIIVCGLSEKQGFKPVNGFDAVRVSNALAQACSDKMEPCVRATVDIVDFEGSLVVVARIPELPPHQKPCYVRARSLYEGSFIRVADGDHHLSRYEVDRLLEERRQPTYDEALVEGSTMADLHDGLVEAFVQRVRRTSSRMVREMSTTEILRIKGVIAYDGNEVLRPTLAGLMALGRYPQQFFPQARVSFLVVPGLSKAALSAEGNRFIDSRFFEGPIPFMIEEALYHVNRNERISSRIEGAFRSDTPDYPDVAVREALANALLHRDYSPEGLASAVQVNMYDDRIEIMNPGGLYGSVTVGKLGVLGQAAARNQVLAGILEATPYNPHAVQGGEGTASLDPDYVVENKGTGFYQIQAALARAGMELPVVRDYVSTFQLLIYQKNMSSGRAEALVPLSAAGIGREQREGAVAPRYDGSTASTVEYAVVKLIEEKGIAKAEDVIEHTGKSKATVNRLLNRLIDKGIVERIGGQRGPGVAYRIVAQLNLSQEKVNIR